MAITPGGDNELEVEITGDGSSLSAAIAAAKSNIDGLMKKVGALSGVLGALGVAGFGAAVNEARKFEEAMVEVEKVTDPQTAREMGDAIKGMAKEIPLAHEELADLTAQAGRFGIRGSENLEKFVRTAAKMATATDLSTEKAGEAFARLSTLMGLPIQDADKLGSAINQLSNEAATSSQEIVDSMLRSSGALTQMGMSSQEIVALSGALNEVSESSERAGTRLRRVAQEMVDPRTVSDLAGAMSMTADEFKRVRDESPLRVMKMMAQRMAEGGEKAEALNGVLSTTSRMALGALGQNLDGLNAALETTAGQFEDATSLNREFEAAIDTFNAQLTLVRNRIRGVAITLAEALIPVLTDLLKRVGPIIDRIDEWVGTLSDTQIKLAAVQSAVMAVAGTIGYFVPQLAAAMVAVQLLSAAILTHHEEIRNFLLPIYEAIVEEVQGVQNAADETGSAFKDAFAPAFDAFDRLDRAASSAAGSVAGSLQTKLVGGIRSAGTKARAALRQMTGFFVSNAEEIQGTLRNLETNIRTEFEGAMLKAKAAVDRGLTTLRTTIVQPGLALLEEQWNTHGDEIRRVIDDAMTYVEDRPDEALAIALGRVIPGLGTLYQAFKRNMADIEDTVRVSMAAVDRQIFDHLTNSESNTRSTLSSMGTEVRQSFAMIQDIIARVMRVVNQNIDEHLGGILALWRLHISGGDGLLADAREAFNTLWKHIIKPTLDLIQNLWKTFGDDLIRVLDGTLGTLLKLTEIGLDFILTSIQVVLDLISGDWQGAMDAVSGFTKRTFRTIGEWLKTDAKNIISGAFGILVDAAKWPFEQLYNWLIGGSFIPKLIGDVANWLKSTGKKLVKKAFGMIVGGAQAAIKNISLGPIMDAVGGVIDAANDAIRALGNIPRNVSTSVTRTVTTRKRTVFEDSAQTRNVSDGGSGSGSGMLTPFQHGGIVTAPTPALIGEAGPEAIAPLDKLPSILAAAAQEAGGGGAPQTVNNIEFEVHADRDTNGSRVGRDIADELRSRNFN